MRDIWERVDTNNLSETTFKRFVATIYRLIQHDKQNFDVMLVGGNTILELDIKNQISDYRIPSFGKVLFVDDEISVCTTAKVCLKALANSVQPCEKIDLSVTFWSDLKFVGFHFGISLCLWYNEVTQFMKPLAEHRKVEDICLYFKTGIRK